MTSIANRQSQAESIGLDLLLEAIYRRYGYDFRSYARASIGRRVRQFASSAGCESVAAMIPRVLEDEDFFSRMVQYFSVGVTEMFRDPFVYRALREEVLPVLRTWPHVKIWCAGCASGEEAYSLAIVLSEDCPSPRFALRVPRSTPFRGVAVGGSAGGVEALDALLAGLGSDFAAPVLVVQHLHATDDGAFSHHVARSTRLRVVEAYDKCRIEPGCVYTAPANYHMLLEGDGSLGLSVDESVNWSRPSIDVLLESVALAWGAGAVAVILSGANSDGAHGIEAVHRAGGLTIAQDPDTAETPVMPRAAMDTGAVDEVLRPERIGERLARVISSHSSSVRDQ